ncbi:MAG: DUF3097 family protein [Ilumatobacteraceae bacterium]
METRRVPPRGPASDARAPGRCSRRRRAARHGVGIGRRCRIGRLAGQGRAASRIWVEGIHDAELLEQVWGADLRELGIVVEPMHGADGLADAVAEFRPGPGRRLGVLLDHLVAGSKETRLAADVHARHGESLLVTGHPFVDVWAGVRPGLVGLDEWPTVDRSVPWKEGVCRALGADAARFWPQLRERVRTYADLRPELVGAVERLIDFVDAGADVGAGDGPTMIDASSGPSRGVPADDGGG